MERLPAVSLCRFGFEVVPDADVARALDAQVVDARRPGDAPPQHDDAQTRRYRTASRWPRRRRNAGPHSTGLEVKILAVFR